MSFQLLPLLDTMIDLYEQPRNPARFQTYLQLLQGDSKDDMLLPIGVFNPMAKEHVLAQLRQLQQLDIEGIITSTLANLNEDLTPKNVPTFGVAFNLADDLHGAWTNRYTTDYDSRFKINALVERGFCTPIFWTSETITEELVQQRSRKAVWRTTYFSEHGRCRTLGQHLKQEHWVAERSGLSWTMDGTSQQFIQQQKDAEDYAMIFNCLYGDSASKSLGFKTYGMQGSFYQ